MNDVDLSLWWTTLSDFVADPSQLWLLIGGGAATVTTLVLAARRARSKPKHPPSDAAHPQATPLPADAERTPLEASGQAARPAEVAEIAALDQRSWMVRLRQGLSKTRTALQSNLEELFSRQGALDSATLDELHETLFRSDIGVMTTDKLVEHVRLGLKGVNDKSWPQVQQLLHDKCLELIGEPPASLSYPAEGPLVILVVGVNGVGKTTTIGKLSAQFLAEGKSVLLCAADTFRAAAIDQLKVWGERLDVKVIAHQQGSDPAAVAYDAVKAAVSRQYDVLIIDTAGRLHSKNDLMAELDKIKRVIGKDLPEAPHETWLVVDATTGQNAVEQVKAFKAVVNLSGLVVTKLDGTAKGGVIIGICDQFKLPIRFIGVGEKTADLRPFSPADYAASLFS